MKKLAFIMSVVGFLVIVPNRVSAHCDTLDGPVVMDARTALKNKDVTPVLKWVKQNDEEGIKKVFNETLDQIAQNPQGRETAEMKLFSELVRIHRAGEGASFEGLKPAGQVEPIVKAADEAIEKGSASELNNKITEGTQERFNRVLETLKHKDESVEAGREYVEAYVDFMHYVEGLYTAAAGPAVHDAHGAAPQEHNHHNE